MKIYIERKIESAENLPKEAGIYICHYAKTSQLTEYHYIGLESNIQFWLNHIDWYFEPIEIEDCEAKDSKETKYTPDDIDMAYCAGVFNTSGIDGLSKELERLKHIGRKPRDIFKRKIIPLIN